MACVKLILVGGFLGAGKTTLLARAAERLSLRGLRVALITNDQATNLVDTEALRRAGQEVKEVSGACFCCAFNKLLYTCDKLVSEYHPDVLIGEPVGSCTDLSATVLQPLKKHCADRYDLAPYSVLADPVRLGEEYSGDEESDMPKSVRYIFRKQLQEADLIVLNKIDALRAEQVDRLRAVVAREFPGVPAMEMSALAGAGVDDWLDRMLSGGPAGRRIAEVDYDTYAEGEALLGWLNATVRLRCDPPADWRAFCLRFLRRMQDEFRSTSAEIAHLKLLLTAGGEKLQANLTGTGAEPSVQHTPRAANDAARPMDALPVPSGEAAMIVNARVRTGPEELRSVVERCLRAAGEGIAVEVTEISSFSPARPKPVHRFGKVV